MIGPRTLDGGYSDPSHVISSAMESVVAVVVDDDTFGRVEVMEVTEVMVRVGFGANAVEMARMVARMRNESLAILKVL